MTVDVDLSEAIEQIDDNTLLEEVKDRKLSLGRDDFDPIEDLQEVEAALLRGHAAEALAILDRLLRPKWKNVGSCEVDFNRVRKLALPIG